MEAKLWTTSNWKYRSFLTTVIISEIPILGSRSYNWEGLGESLKSYDWRQCLIPPLSLSIFSNILAFDISSFAPIRSKSVKRLTKFLRERMFLMRKRTKLIKKLQLKKACLIDKQILLSHEKEAVFNESIIIKIRSTSSYILGMLRNSLWGELLQLRSTDSTLTDNRIEICKLLFSQCFFQILLLTMLLKTLSLSLILA